MAGNVIGNYRILAELKRGGMGVVYRAQHATMGQHAVVKKLLPEHTGNAEVVQRFFQEAQAAAALDDPGIVRIFDQGVLADGSAYIVMELLQGESLADRLARERRIAADRAAVYFRQAARAVGKAHSRGIVHRDLKPDNLFIVPDPDVAIGERIKVLDFGIAKLAGDGARVKTMTQMPMGTPAYMSPEQWSSAGRVDGRTDVYAFGIILFEMLTGRLPYEGPGLLEFIDQHRFTPVPAPSSVDPSLRPYDHVVMRALAKQAEERFGSLDEMVQALPGGGVSAPTPVAAPMWSAPTLPAGSAQMVAANAPAPSTLGHAAAQAVTAPPATPSRTGLWIALVALLAAGGVGAAFALRGGDDAPKSTAQAQAPTPKPPDAAPRAEAPAVDAGPAVVAAAPVDAAPVPEPAPTPAPKDVEPPKPKDRSRSAASAAVAGDAKAEPPAEPPPATKSRCPDEVECLLMESPPACCGKRGGKKPDPQPERDEASVPEALTKAIISDGVSKVKRRVFACAEKYPSAKGTVKVSVKVAPSGEVTSVTVKESPDPGVGSCVASAMERASFAKTQNGGSFSYPFVF